MYSPFSLLHQHMGSMLDAFEHETFPAYSQRGYRGYQRQPDLYRSLYEPHPAYPCYVQPQPHLHLIDVSLPVADQQEEHELSVEEQLRQQLAQQKINAAQANVKTNTNNKQSPSPQPGQASSAVTTGSTTSQQQVAARDEAADQDPLNSLFRSLFRPSTDTQSLINSTLPAELQPLQKLRVDVSEDDSGMTVKAEIAGLSKEDVQLTVKDHVLTIAASKQSQREQHAAGGDDGTQQGAAAAAGKEPVQEKVKEGAQDDNKHVTEQAKSPQPSSSTTTSRILHRELYSGKVSRSLRLPRQADLSAISASCKDGLLTVRVPYKQSQEPEQRTIAIN